MKLRNMLLMALVLLTTGAATTACAEQEIGWSSAQAGSMRGRIGHRAAYYCPPNGQISDRLWGSGLYTDDSSVCTAAVHAGLISTYDGGKVVIEIRPGAGSYMGSRKNGVNSKSYGSFQGSFVFVSGGHRHAGDVVYEEPVRRPDPRSPVPHDFGVPVPGGYGPLPPVERHMPPPHVNRRHTVDINWGTTAGEERGKNGRRFSYFCPPGGSYGSVWGNGLYTDDSSICTAAVHAGLITRHNGGEVTIEIRPGAHSYHGSHRHGVSSQGYGSFDGSFVFIR